MFLFLLIFLARILQYCLAAVDVAPFPSLLRMSGTIRLVTWTANCHFTGYAEVVRLQTQIFPGFSFFRAGSIQTFLVQIHRDVLILPRVLQQLTMG